MVSENYMKKSFYITCLATGSFCVRESSDCDKRQTLPTILSEDSIVLEKDFDGDYVFSAKAFFVRTMA